MLIDTALLIKMAVVAGVVVFATTVAERTRPAVAALVATLPFSVGSAFVLIAMQHDAAFVAAAALKSVAGVTITTLFVLVYALVAGAGWGVLASVAAGYAVWLPVAYLSYRIGWTPLTAVLFSVVVTLVAYRLTARFRRLESSARGARHWYDPVMRGASVALLVGMLTAMSDKLGPAGVGTLANFPIIMTSVGVVVHRRLGGAAITSLMAHSILGMAGVSLALLVVHLAAADWGRALALLAALAICIGWNFVLYRLARRITPPPAPSAGTTPPTPRAG